MSTEFSLALEMPPGSTTRQERTVVSGRAEAVVTTSTESRLPAEQKQVRVTVVVRGSDSGTKIAEANRRMSGGVVRR